MDQERGRNVIHFASANILTKGQKYISENIRRSSRFVRWIDLVFTVSISNENPYSVHLSTTKET